MESVAASEAAAAAADAVVVVVVPVASALGSSVVLVASAFAVFLAQPYLDSAASSDASAVQAKPPQTLPGFARTLASEWVVQSGFAPVAPGSGQ